MKALTGIPIGHQCAWFEAMGFDWGKLRFVAYLHLHDRAGEGRPEPPGHLPDEVVTCFDTRRGDPT